MKDLGKTKYCLGLQIEHTHERILVHRSAYTKKVLNKFNMKNAYPLRTHIAGRSLDVEKNIFRPKEENEKVLGS